MKPGDLVDELYHGAPEDLEVDAQVVPEAVQGHGPHTLGAGSGVMEQVSQCAKFFKVWKSRSEICTL